MTPSLQYIGLAGVLLLGPGLWAAMLLRQAVPGFLVAFSFSYGLFVAGIAVAARLGLSLDDWITGYLVAAASAILLAVAIAVRRIRHSRLQNPRMAYFSASMPAALAGLVIVVAANLAYHVAVGPYLEVPADVLFHLEIGQQTAHRLGGAVEDGTPISEIVYHKNGPWYLFLALVPQLLGDSLVNVLPGAVIFNTTVFLTAVYLFGLRVLRPLFPSSRWIAAASVAATTLCFLHFGTSVFAFVRYYALAPVILNMVLFLTLMASVMAFLEKRPASTVTLACCLPLIPVTYVVHKQETLLFLVAAILLVAYHGASEFAGRGNGSGNEWTDAARRGARIRLRAGRTVIIMVLTLAAVVAGGTYLHLYLPRAGIHSPNLIPLEAVLPFVRHLYILNPTFQFYETVTLWGLLVYAAFLVRWRWFAGSPYLFVTMISPLFTVFNPLFVDLFLRSGGSSITLWRMCFLIPLFWAGGALFVDWIRRATVAAHSSLRRIVTVLGAVLFLLPVMPLDATYLHSRFSRISTIVPLPEDNTVTHWADLLDFLRGLDERQKILTDPVTGYMIASMTHHISPRYKFFDRGNHAINLSDYADDPFLDFRGWILVVNGRDGGASRNGALARHWPEDVLKVSAYYDEILIRHIDESPDVFRRIWSADGITVYRIPKLPG